MIFARILAVIFARILTSWGKILYRSDCFYLADNCSLFWEKRILLLIGVHSWTSRLYSVTSSEPEASVIFFMARSKMIDMLDSPNGLRLSLDMLRPTSKEKKGDKVGRSGEQLARLSQGRQCPAASPSGRHGRWLCCSFFFSSLIGFFLGSLLIYYLKRPATAIHLYKAIHDCIWRLVHELHPRYPSYSMKSFTKAFL